MTLVAMETMHTPLDLSIVINKCRFPPFYAGDIYVGLRVKQEQEANFDIYGCIQGLSVKTETCVLSLTFSLS